MFPISVTTPVVLLVEDEPIIRALVADVLVESGCIVVQAATGAEALAHLRERQDIEVMVTDVDLRGRVSGLDVTDVVARERPDIRVIVTSGAEPSPLPRNGLFLAKPYCSQRLCEAVLA